MAIRKPIKLTWDGEEYKIIVNMLLIERIDDEVNILKLISMDKDSASIVKISKFLWALLDEAGAGVSWEEVYEGLGDPDNIDKDDLYKVIQEITPMLLPQFKVVAKKKTTKRKKKK